MSQDAKNVASPTAEIDCLRHVINTPCRAGPTRLFPYPKKVLKSNFWGRKEIQNKYVTKRICTKRTKNTVTWAAG